MTHAEPENEGSKLGKGINTATVVTKEVLKDPGYQGKIKLGLNKLGNFLKGRAKIPETRQERAVSLFDTLTPEAQAALLKDRQSWFHAAKEGTLNSILPGRSIYKLGKPSLAPRDWVTLEDYSEELEVYIGLGITSADETVAQEVDGMLENKVHMLKWVAAACVFIPEAGLAVAELLSGIAHLAEAPASFLKDNLREVRDAVRSGTEIKIEDQVTAEVEGERQAIEDGLAPNLHLN